MALSALLLMQSCSLQQRRYTGGFQLQWTTGSKAHGKASAKSAPSMRSESHGIAKDIDRNTVMQIESKKGVGTGFPNHLALSTLELTRSQPNFHSPKHVNLNRIYGPFTGKRHGSVASNHPFEKATPHRPSNQKARISQKKHSMTLSPPDGYDIVKLIFGILGIIFGWNKSSSSYGGLFEGSYIDWTVVFVIIGLAFSTFGLIYTIAGASSFSAMALKGMMGAFTIMGAIFSGIGLIKSINEYYDAGIYMSYGSFALLAVMWIVGLLMI